MLTRRYLLLLFLGLGSLSVPVPAHAAWFLVGSRFILGAARGVRALRIASTTSRAFRAGVRVSRTSSPVRYGSVSRGSSRSARVQPQYGRTGSSSAPGRLSPATARDLARQYRPLTAEEKRKLRSNAAKVVDTYKQNLAQEDRRKLLDNLVDFVDKIQTASDIGDALHLLEEIDRHDEADILGYRAEVDQCLGCKRSYQRLLRGTDLAQIPVIFDGEITVIGERVREPDEGNIIW